MASDAAMDKLSLAYIEEAIKTCYNEKGNQMTVTDIARFLAKGGESVQQEIAKRLYPYTAEGAYAQFFEGENSLNPQSNLVVFELEELKSKKDLQEVVLLTLIFAVQQEMLNREKPKLLLIDEAWDLLTGGNTTSFMETMYRRIRKYRGACFSITQSINDFYRIPAGVAMIENSDFYLLLKQRVESIEALKTSQRVMLSEGLYELMKSVSTDMGNYSEIFCYTPVGVGIGRLVVDRFTQLLYTSKADEYTKIKRKVDQGLSIADAINEVIKEEQSAFVKTG
jgi:conjugal transfer ATP-binding protein TraC